MNNIKHDLWRKWNEEGFFPGPEETEEEFQKRVNYCQNLRFHLENETESFPFDVKEASFQNILDEAFSITKPHYGIAPHWVILFFNNYQLSPWHGGCAWIFQLNEHSPVSAFLQLRKRFQYSSHYLGIYSRSELIAHEMAHIGRMMYQEPQFEEFFAYCSSSGYRKWIGPIVQSSKETLFFILLLGLVVITDLSLLFTESNNFLQLNAISWWVKLLPISCVIFAFCRLFYRHTLLKRCLKNLELLYDPQDAKHLLYRLRDCEIKQFSRSNPSQILENITTLAHNSFRWEFLNSLIIFSSKVKNKF